jgi:hypothetical protein
MAVFPAAVATDSDLLVAADLASTTLTSPINNSTLTVPVANGTKFKIGSVISIESEQILLSGVGSLSLTVAPGGRGYGGTTAASHVSGVDVRNNVVAAYHNQLAGEIKAIEGTIGANLSGLALSGSITPASVNFTPRTPGGTLSAGSNTITLAPVPKGVNGTDVGHYLYISGGTGSPEVVLITGGTAVSGASTGTVIVTCAGTHSGAWTIGSATAGIQEAIQVLQTAGIGGTVQLPAATLDTYGPIILAGSGIDLRGTGRSATKIHHRGAYNVITMDGTLSGGSVQAQNVVDRMQIYTDSQSNGNYGIVVKDQNTAIVRDTHVSNVQHGIHITGGFGAFILELGLSYVGTNGVGIWVDGGAEHFIDHYVATAGVSDSLAGIRITETGGTWISSSDVMEFGTGLLIDPPNGRLVGNIWVRDTALDTSVVDGIRIAPAATGKAHSMNFSNCWTCTGGRCGVFVDATSGGYVREINFAQHRSNLNVNAGFKISGSVLQTTITASTIGANGRNADGSFPGILVTGNPATMTITDNYIGSLEDPTSLTLLARPSYGIQLTGTGTITNLIIRGNRISDYTLGFISGIDTIFADAHVIDGNIGNSTYGGAVASHSRPVIASASTISLTAIPYESYEITGTVAISVIGPGWIGRRIRLAFTNASPAGLTGGGNIRKVVSVTQNTCLELVMAADGFWDIPGK